MSGFLDRIVRFVAVIDHGSVTKAAASLNIDQPALSKQIARLEDELGFTVFERGHGRLVLSSEGRALLATARKLADAAAGLRSSMRQIARGLRTVKMGVSAYSFWVPIRNVIIEQFRARHPELTLEIASDRIASMLTQLRHGDIDVAIISHPPDDDGTFEYLPLYQARAGMLLPAEDPLAAADKVELADLAGRTLVVTRAPHAPGFYAPYLDAGMVERLVPEGRVAMTFYAERERLCMLTWDCGGPEVPMPAGFVHRVVDDAAEVVRYGIVRLRDDQRRSVASLWDIATEATRASVAIS